MTNETREYFFKDKDKLIAHIINKLDNPTPLKIQKGLYFLWAFYSATYGNINYEEGETEFNLQDEYPNELFAADFEAWRYGPVLPDVYRKFKNGEYDDIDDTYVPETENEKEVMSFIDDLISQINGINDFGLVTRSHQDEAWKKSFKNENHCKMHKEDIKEDYEEYVKE
ncbi:Panacea domain-containing protein [Liquorilactobacillus hordei]|uniref:Panacea domain-containing protein n=1 Tax=Liquorilactobacillus hordei TaxID=468911 RepID=UPI001CC0650A|nr:type II toxin-antitoxin system antitoxin SocA domain-containing protein [Liquorilactobacillus hordei]MBZ2406142.1 hypothetical protein [Liquorilactobacillus hordei]